MSTIIMSACWELQGMSPAQKAVLVSLADQANDSGVCWPGIKTIERRTCLSERAVQDALRWLQATGALWRDYKQNSSSVYTVTPQNFDPSKAPEKRSRKRGADGAPPADGAPGANGAPPPADGAPPPANGAPPPPQEAHQGVANGAPKSKENRNRNRKGTTNEPITTEADATVEPMTVVAPNGTVYEIPGELKYPGEDTKTHKAWIAYAIAYERRYGAWPVWNAMVAGQISKFIDRVGVDNAPYVAVHYVRRVNEQFVVQQMHPVKLLLSDAEKWLTQAQTNRTVTRTEAQQADKSQSNLNTAQAAADFARQIIAKREREDQEDAAGGGHAE